MSHFSVCAVYECVFGSGLHAACQRLFFSISFLFLIKHQIFHLRILFSSLLFVALVSFLSVRNSVEKGKKKRWNVCQNRPKLTGSINNWTYNDDIENRCEKKNCSADIINMQSRGVLLTNGKLNGTHKDKMWFDYMLLSILTKFICIFYVGNVDKSASK